MGLYNVAKRLGFTIEDRKFRWECPGRSSSRRRRPWTALMWSAAAKARDSIGPDAVRRYKNLATMERAFRCLKEMDIRIRPIFHLPKPGIGLDKMRKGLHIANAHELLRIFRTDSKGLISPLFLQFLAT